MRTESIIPLLLVTLLSVSCLKEETPSDKPSRETEEVTKHTQFQFRSQHQFLINQKNWEEYTAKERALYEAALKSTEPKLDSMNENCLKNLDYTFQLDSISSAKIFLSQGHLLSSDKRHTEIMVVTSDNRYLTLWSGGDTIIHLNYWWENYSERAYKDLNNDGFKDLVVQWYPSSGCCPRDIRDVYLYDPGNDAFTEKFEFPNPKFYPRERKIRGMQYGHPGETSLYCYRWRGLNLDTLEYIHPNPEDSTFSSFIRTDASWLGDTTSKWAEKIKAPDTKYRELETYYWFLGNYTD